jgi:hypothetical protein
MAYRAVSYIPPYVWSQNGMNVPTLATYSMEFLHDLVKACKIFDDIDIVGSHVTEKAVDDLDLGASCCHLLGKPHLACVRTMTEVGDQQGSRRDDAPKELETNS